MPLVMLLSDPHFGTERPEVVQALLALSAHERPEVLVWCGDLTQRARRAQFDAARHTSEQIGARHTVCVPGNHDIPLFNVLVRMFDPYGGYRRAFGPPEDVRLTRPGLSLIALNTTRPWRHKHGEVSRAQVARAARWLRRAAPGQLRVVVTHQPVWVAHARDQRDLLRGHAAALRAWAAAGADVLVSGHIHLPGIDTVPVLSTGRARPLWYVQSGTAVSSRVRHGTRNAVHLIRYSVPPTPPAVAIEQWEFDAAQMAFQLVHTRPL